MSVTVYLIWYLAAGVGAFNVDVTNPIVLRSPSRRTDDDSAAYFGFSLAFYRSHEDALWCGYTLYYYHWVCETATSGVRTQLRNKNIKIFT